MFSLGRAISQAISRAFSTQRPRSLPGQDQGGFMVDRVALDKTSSKFFPFPCKYHSCWDPHPYATWGINNRPVDGCIWETYSHPVDRKKTRACSPSLKIHDGFKWWLFKKVFLQHFWHYELPFSFNLYSIATPEVREPWGEEHWFRLLMCTTCLLFTIHVMQ